MNGRKIMLAASAVFIVIAAIFGYKWFSAEPSLFVHLRCNGEVSGKLNAAMVLSNGESVKDESYDVKSVCRAGKVELSGYEREMSIHFKLERDDGQIIKLVSEYGSDILRDPNEFNMIIKLTDTPPFIANDRL